MAIYKILSTGAYILADEAFCEQNHPNDWEYVGEETQPPAPTPVVKRRVTKLEFVRRLGDDFDTLFAEAKVNIEVEKFMKMIDWATPDPDGTSIDLDDPRVIGSLQKCEQDGTLAQGRAAEILA